MYRLNGFEFNEEELLELLRVVAASPNGLSLTALHKEKFVLPKNKIRAERQRLLTVALTNNLLRKVNAVTHTRGRPEKLLFLVPLTDFSSNVHPNVLSVLQQAPTSPVIKSAAQNYRSILNHLPATEKQLQTTLGLSRNAVRRRLTALMYDGFVTWEKDSRNKVTNPPRLYRKCAK